MTVEQTSLPSRNPLKLIFESLNRATRSFTFKELAFIYLILHVFVISFPRDGLVFDEAYYVPAARDILHLVPSNPEHPFLGKLWGAIGIALFGDNWFGWRISSVIFGFFTLIVFYKLAKLYLDERHALYAAAILNFDTIFFAHSSLCLLEVPALFFAILSIYLYLKKSYWFSAGAMGLSILSKETSLFFLATLALYHLIQHLKPFLVERREAIRSIGRSAGYLGVVVLVFGASTWAYDIVYQPPLQTRVNVIEETVVGPHGTSTTYRTTTEVLDKIDNPIEHVTYIMGYASSLTIRPWDDVTQNNYAWNWVLPILPLAMTYYDVEIAKNVTEFADGAEVSSKIYTSHPIQWKGIVDLPLWVGGFWLVVLYSTFALLLRKGGRVDVFILAWILGTYGPYLLMSAVVGRIVYPFYFINTAPILALGVPYVVNKFGSSRYNLACFMIAILIWFLWFFPVRIYAF